MRRHTGGPAEIRSWDTLNCCAYNVAEMVSVARWPVRATATIWSGIRSD